ncbi:hypothetical protein GALL_471830 [mine drainage metagenome]|uniref:Uncharacterized protein n=1 Tax=mine drainage metagenome TaxID=410659 RepID=A0A1J5PTY1_9ZZZZ
MAIVPIDSPITATRRLALAASIRADRTNATPQAISAAVPA